METWTDSRYIKCYQNRACVRLQVTFSDRNFWHHLGISSSTTFLVSLKNLQRLFIAYYASQTVCLLTTALPCPATWSYFLVLLESCILSLPQPHACLLYTPAHTSAPCPHYLSFLPSDSLNGEILQPNSSYPLQKAFSNCSSSKNPPTVWVQKTFSW